MNDDAVKQRHRSACIAGKPRSHRYPARPAIALCQRKCRKEFTTIKVALSPGR
jgi:hypothetical protein